MPPVLHYPMRGHFQSRPPDAYLPLFIQASHSTDSPPAALPEQDQQPEQIARRLSERSPQSEAPIHQRETTMLQFGWSWIGRSLVNELCKMHQTPEGTCGMRQGW